MRFYFKLIFSLLILTITSCTVSKNTSKNNTSDNEGKSLKTAIAVNSVSEEYAYVRKVCPECNFTGQALIFEKNKPYDVLNFRKNGKKVSYYFDISSFFGKGF